MELDVEGLAVGHVLLTDSMSQVLFAGLGEVGLEVAGGVEASDDGGGDDLASFDVGGEMHAADEAALFVFFSALGEGLGAVGIDAGEDHRDRPAVHAVAGWVGGTV